MARNTPTPPSFSRRRKWSIGFNVILAAIAVLAVAVGVNYISSQILFKRFYLSTHTRIELSPRTLGLLRSLTNQISVTLYYNKEDPLYDDVAALLNEYRLLNPKISVTTVDYTRDVSEPQRIKAKYNLVLPTDKNLVIFDCAGRFKVISGDALGQYAWEQIPSEDPQKPEYRKKPLAFYGEILFTSALLQVLNPKPLKAYFLQGDGEPAIDARDDQLGFTKFAGVLRQNYIQVEALPPGTNPVPLDCNLLIIAGPRTAIPEPELSQIEQYLNQGGRLFAAFNLSSVNREIGLEQILAKWGVHVSHSTVKDAQTFTGSDVAVEQFANHPAVNPLVGSQLYLVQPRMIGKLDLPGQNVDAPKVEEIAFSSTNSVLMDHPLSKPRSFPLMVAVDKGTVKGVVPERGSTRILVVGDSVFLGNVGITSLGNSDFTSFAANWLLDRTVLLQGIGPRPVTEYRLMLAQNQKQTVEWILLGAMPGGVLLLGGLVWLRRRR